MRRVETRRHLSLGRDHAAIAAYVGRRFTAEACRLVCLIGMSIHSVDHYSIGRWGCSGSERTRADRNADLGPGPIEAYH